MDSTLSKRKLFVFKVIALLLPVLCLVLFELILRWVHYGQDFHLFIESGNHKQYWVMNPAISQKYFVQKENAPIGLQEPFLKKKSANTYRIFVLGESTTLGFPYRTGSFHYWLKYRLMHTFPEKNFEVINLSLTAVNSITVYDFAKEVVRYQPDAVLVYVGHNEYYGALGVGSTSNIGNNLAVIRIKLLCQKLRLVQLLSAVFHSFTSKAVNSSHQQMMQRMASDQHIGYQSKKYYKGIQQFEQNLLDMCKIFSKRNIPLLVSNLVSNEKDLEPFISDTSVERNSAIYQYKLAKQAFEKGNFAEAKTGFVLAKDLDELRFRAPEAINQSIPRITHMFKGVYLVDTKASFEAHSPHGILGKETILEHVHPNLYGYALIADAFYSTMVNHQLLFPQKDSEMSFSQLLKQMPVLTIDSLQGIYVTEHMKQEWPFSAPKKDFSVGTSFEELLCWKLEKSIIPWDKALDTILLHYKTVKNWAEACKTAEVALLQDPFNEKPYLIAASMCMKMHDLNKMLFYLQKAYALQPQSNIGKYIITICLYTDHPDKAIPYLDSMIRKEPSDQDLIRTRMLTMQLAKLKEGYAMDSSNINLLNALASAYYLLHNKPVCLLFAKGHACSIR